MQTHITKILPDIINIRQNIHRNPELKFAEKETAQLITNTLKSFGYENIQNGIGKTGVVAVLDSGKPGKTVALRADMDALPLQEENHDIPYQSKNAGIMHACGHDGHTASLLGAAYALKQLTNQFSGKIKFIFQPGEEGGAGALEMIKDGVLDNPKVDAIFGYHNWHREGLAKFSTRNGCVLASTTQFTITLSGQGGHAAVPDTTNDPIYIGACLIQNLQSIVSRWTRPIEPVVVSVTQFSSGNTYNIIPEKALIKGTIRTTSLANKELVKQKFSNIVTKTAEMYGAKADIEIVDSYPPTINTAAETELVQKTAKQVLGDNSFVEMLGPVMGAEDFSFFLQQIPGCYYFLGNGSGNVPIHSSRYNYNDDLLNFAIAMFCQIAINYLQQA